jgi:hypothetical protein
MSNLVQNERTKLFATFLNNAGVAVMAGGLFVPAMTYQPLHLMVIGMVLGVVVGLSFNFVADRWLQNHLRE